MLEILGRPGLLASLAALLASIGVEVHAEMLHNILEVMGAVIALIGLVSGVARARNGGT